MHGRGHLPGPQLDPLQMARRVHVLRGGGQQGEVIFGGGDDKCAGRRPHGHPGLGLGLADRGDGGHAARCTDPGCQADQASSVTNGRNGANSRSATDSAQRSVAAADSAAGAPRSPYARAFTSSR